MYECNCRCLRGNVKKGIYFNIKETKINKTKKNIKKIIVSTK